MITEPHANQAGLPDADQAAVDAIVSSGPIGAIALAGLTALIVLALWFAFYLLVFVPRG
jgi:hypothetical protein